MSDYSKELKQYLQKEGCYFERQGKGDHEIWLSPIGYFTGAKLNKFNRRQSERQTR